MAYESPPRAGISLSSLERRVILALGEAAIPPVKGISVPLSGIREVWLAKFEDLLSKMPAEQRKGLRFLFVLAEYSPLLFHLRFRRFSALPAPDRERILEAWESSRWMGRRLSLLALKALMGMCYCSMDDVSAQLGYDRKCLREDAPLSVVRYTEHGHHLRFQMEAEPRSDRGSASEPKLKL